MEDEPVTPEKRDTSKHAYPVYHAFNRGKWLTQEIRAQQCSLGKIEFIPVNPGREDGEELESVKFRDALGRECILSQSTEKDCVWLGIEGQRMLLDKFMAGDLADVLMDFSQHQTLDSGYCVD